MYFDSAPCMTYLERLLEDKAEDKATNGVVIDREAYLRDIEGFQDREVTYLTSHPVYYYNRISLGFRDNAS